MCFSTPDMPAPKDEPVVQPPPPPPPPAPTAQGLTIGGDRKAVPLQNFLSNALGAKKPRNPLRIDLGGTAPVTASGLNIPQG